MNNIQTYASHADRQMARTTAGIFFSNRRKKY